MIMVDVLTPRQRHYNMTQIKGKNTKPEISLRKIVFSLGYRYRLHLSSLPGKPDLVFPSRKKVIFLHGCFWHMHGCKYGSVTPQTNIEFWQKKRTETTLRDTRNIAELESLEWDVLVVWECMLKDKIRLEEIIVEFLGRKPVNVL